MTKAEQEEFLAGLGPAEQAAVRAKQALLQAEAFLVSLKDSADAEELRGVKESLRQQRQAYRETHRATVMALEAGRDIQVTPDSIKVSSG